MLFLLIGLAAWPVFVAVNIAISFFQGEGSVVDLWTQEPKRNLLAGFLEGYEKSALFAVFVGVIAAVDFQLLSKNRLTGFVAGIFIPLFCISLAFIFYAEPGLVLHSFALTGFALWMLYKIVDIGFRLRRTN